MRIGIAWHLRGPGAPGREKKSPLDWEGAFIGRPDRLRRLFYIRVGRCRDRIRKVVVVGLHRDDLRWYLRTRRLFFRNARYRKNDAAMDRIDLENPQIEIHRLVDDVRRTVHRLTEVELTHWNEALDVVADVDDHALVHQPHYPAFQFGSDRIGLSDPEPRILGRLLEAERDALVLGVDVQDHDIHRVTLLHDFRRMLNPLGPRHVRDVNQSVDAGLDLDERAKAREVANLAVETRPDRILLRQHHPRILLRLLHAEGDLLLVRIDLEHDRLDCLTD